MSIMYHEVIHVIFYPELSGHLPDVSVHGRLDDLIQQFHDAYCFDLDILVDCNNSVIINVNIYNCLLELCCEMLPSESFPMTISSSSLRVIQVAPTTSTSSTSSFMLLLCDWPLHSRSLIYLYVNYNLNFYRDLYHLSITIVVIVDH